MGAFVEKQDTLLWNYEEGIYGMPKELWDNHFKTFRDETRPVSEEEYMQYFTKTRAAISERGYRISRGLIRAQRREIAMKLGENILMPGISFEEYSQDVFDNSFTDKDKENTKKMWDLLSSITPFEDYERDFIEDNLYPNIGDVVTFSYYREHMDEEIYNQLKEMMEFIYDNPGNEFLTAMIVDFLV